VPTDVPIAEISVDDLAPRWETGATVIDVRMPDEFAEVRVPGARLIPLPELPERITEIPADGEVFVICRSGARSARAVEFLAANGREAINVAGGTLAWVDSGRPTEAGPTGG
jgi:rhodanese-related sulfurtransferase